MAEQSLNRSRKKRVPVSSMLGSRHNRWPNEYSCFEDLSKHGNPWWASAEGTNTIPGGTPGNSGKDMETYLARSFNHGAALVTIFGWGIGGQSMPNNPYRTVTEGAEALAAYRKFLAQ